MKRNLIIAGFALLGLAGGGIGIARHLDGINWKQMEQTCSDVRTTRREAKAAFVKYTMAGYYDLASQAEDIYIEAGEEVQLCLSRGL